MLYVWFYRSCLQYGLRGWQAVLATILFSIPLFLFGGVKAGNLDKRINKVKYFKFYNGGGMSPLSGNLFDLYGGDE